MASTWSWISRRRQTEIIQKYSTHIVKVIEVVEHTHDMIKAYSEGKIDDARKKYEEAFNAEREADEIKRKIIEELSTEVFHPIDREELIRLILTTDDIAAYAKAATRRLLLVLNDKLNQEIVSKLLEMASKLYEAVKLLKEAANQLLYNPREALKIADKIERLEEEIDDIRMEALGKVLRFCNEAKPSLCLISKELVDSLENASDRCEDTADVIRSIALLSI